MDLLTRLFGDGELPSLLVEAQAWVAEDTLDIAIKDEVFGCLGCDSSRAVEEPDRVCPAEGQIKLVRRDEDALAELVGERAEHRRHLQTGGEVEVRRGLVEEDERSLLCQGTGDHHALLLAVTQRVEDTLTQLHEATRGECLFADPLVLGTEQTTEARIGVATDGDDLPDVHIARRDALGEHKAQLTGDLLHREAGEGLFAQLHFACKGWEQTRHGVHERGLPTAVGTHEHDDLARANGEAEVGGDDDATATLRVACAEVAELDREVLCLT